MSSKKKSKLKKPKASHWLEQSGFTLAELLIALAVLGVIATFTIPKILDSGSSAKHNSIVMEAAAMVTGAYQNLKLDGNLSPNTSMGDLTAYMNYVNTDTVSDIDHYNNGTSSNCGTSAVCLELHNGAKLLYRTNVTFGSTASTNMLYFIVDPDGVYSGQTTGPSKGAQLFLYYNGRLTSSETAIDPTYYYVGAPAGPLNAASFPDRDPEYLSWKP